MCDVKSITPYTVQLQLHVSYHSSPTPGEGTNHRIATFEVVQSYLQHQYNTSGVLPTSADHPCLGSREGKICARCLVYDQPLDPGTRRAAGICLELEIKVHEVFTITNL